MRLLFIKTGESSTGEFGNSFKCNSIMVTGVNRCRWVISKINQEIEYCNLELEQ